MEKIFIATTTYCKHSLEPLNFLKSHGFHVDTNEKGRKLTDDEISDTVSQYDGIIAGTESYSENILNHAKQLKVISRLGTGVDNIDLKVADRMGINIFNTKTSPALGVAELAFGLILDLSRNISSHNSDLKNGIWEKRMGSLISGKTLGIVGLGTIGKELVNITKGFGLKYLAHDIKIDFEFSDLHQIEYCTLEEVFTKSDIISIHTSLTNENQNLIDFNLLKMMKPDSILINTSRGDIINENDLIKALNQKRIAGAGLDVFSIEPYQGKLLEFDNIVATPHIAGYTKEIRSKMELEAAKNLIKGLGVK